MDLEHVDLSYTGVLLLPSFFPSDRITNLCSGTSQLQLLARACGVRLEVAHERAGVEAMHIHPVQDHQWEQMPNVHGWRRRIYSHVQPNAFLCHQPVKIVSFASSVSKIKSLVTRHSLDFLPYYLIHISPLLQHGQHTLLLPRLDRCSLTCPL